MTMAAPSGTSVRHAVTVPLDRQAAFDLFASRIDSWWPREGHHLGEAPLAEVILEPRSGGRWYERDADGGECDWGRVAAWDPPERLVLIWQIDGTWHFDPDFETTVEVHFTPTASGETRVELEHRNLDRFGDHEQTVRQAFDSAGGWPGLLRDYASAVTTGDATAPQ